MMQVKIRPCEKWPRGYPYEWQPIPNYQNRWYGLHEKNIMFKEENGEARRKTAGEIRNLMNALFQGLTVQVAASYDRQSHTLTVMQ